MIPSSTRETFIRLFVNSPAQTSSAIEIAIWDVASVARNRAAARAPEGWPACPFSVESRSGRVLWSAGKSPKRRPVPIVSDGGKAIATAVDARLQRRRRLRRAGARRSR